MFEWTTEELSQSNLNGFNMVDPFEQDSYSEEPELVSEVLVVVGDDMFLINLDFDRESHENLKTGVIIRKIDDIDIVDEVEPIILAFVEKKAVFAGAEIAIMKFIRDNINYL